MSQVATWVQAVGSTGSFLAFAAFMCIAVLNRRDENEVRLENQAQQVAAWLDYGTHHGYDDGYVVCLHNAAASPVYSCETYVHIPSSNDGAERAMYVHIVPPSMTVVRRVPDNLPRLDAEELYSAAAVPEVRFTDASAWNWRRDRDGRLWRLDGRRRLRIRPRVEPHPSESPQESRSESSSRELANREDLGRGPDSQTPKQHSGPGDDSGPTSGDYRQPIGHSSASETPEQDGGRTTK